MNKPNFSAIARNIKTTLVKRSPEILTGIGIAGMATSTILAVKATPKALILIEEEKRKQKHKYESVEKLTTGEVRRRIVKGELKPMEVVKVTWKCYIPAAVTGIVSTACLIGASTVNLRRNAALATAYGLSETALKEYREKVIETIGEKKEQVVREKIAEDRLEKNPVNDAEVVMTNTGNTLFLEPTSGRYFRSDIERIKRIANEINETLLRDAFGYISLNDWYYELGLESTDIGEVMGWNVAKTGIIRIDPHAKIARNGEPCLVIDYVNAPAYGYDSCM